MTICVWRYLSLVAKDKKVNSNGFTLIELLISIVIASLVTSGLLALVNEVIRVDRREVSLENVQRDMQRSINYVTDDLREAVYVYSTPTTVTSLLTPADLPTGSSNRPARPVLAFWKPEFLSTNESSFLENSVNCDTLSDPLDDECNALKLRQSYYTLVIYFTLENTASDTNSNWDGQARLIRYVLPQYKNAAIRNLATTGGQTSGYTDPVNNFADWEPAAGETTDGDWNVLVDFVDAPVSTSGPPLLTNCNEFGPGYQLSPSTGSTLRSDSFMSCISLPGTAANGTNQEVVVLLRGNAKTAAQELASPTTTDGTATTAFSSSALPVLKSRVLVRGAANKNPN